MAGEGATILIVDDAESNRHVLRVQLEALGHQTCEAGDGVEALSVLERQPVDVVVSDILMPRMDGYRLCREIRQREALRQVPIIVYTGTYLSAEDRKLALRSGADRYLMKPAPLAELQRVLDEVTRRPSTAPAAEPGTDDRSVMQEYNSVLIHKVEQKSRELEQRNVELARVNRELEESRAQAAGIVASAMDAIVTVDDRGAITLCNEAAEAMFRASGESMRGRMLADLFPPEGATGPAIDYSLAGRLGRWLEVVFAPIGFNWQISIALIPGLAAREVAVSALGTVYALSGDDDTIGAELGPMIAAQWPLATALSLLVWFIFAPQCLSTLAVIRRETNSWRTVYITAAYLFALAYAASFVTYHITRMLVS